MRCSAARRASAPSATLELAFDSSTRGHLRSHAESQDRDATAPERVRSRSLVAEARRASGAALDARARTAVRIQPPAESRPQRPAPPAVLQRDCRFAGARSRRPSPPPCMPDAEQSWREDLAVRGCGQGFARPRLAAIGMPARQWWRRPPFRSGRRRCLTRPDRQGRFDADARAIVPAARAER
jgi:hypothetical protein